MTNPRLIYFGLLIMSNAALLLPDGSVGRVIGAWLLLGLLPGYSWADKLLAPHPLPLRFIVGATLSYLLTILSGLLLHYLDGPIEVAPLLLILNGVALAPLLLPPHQPNMPSWRMPRHPISIALAIMFVAALALRLINLNYSEFQGDEALAMLSAAEALTGHEDALFLRSKGPAEVLLPMLMWRLTGTINEGIARLPFTFAAMGAMMTLYLLGTQLILFCSSQPDVAEESNGFRRCFWQWLKPLDSSISLTTTQLIQFGSLSPPHDDDDAPHLPMMMGLFAATLFSLNGFMVAFGRIVQYQALVVWFSSVAMVMVIHWRQTTHHRPILIAIAGASVGGGLLAHYDAILVLPALMWLIVGHNLSALNRTIIKPLIHNLGAIGLLFLSMGLMALPFYLPYSLDPQANRTSAYVGGRIGNELRNNLPDFFHFNSFYSSFYYIAFTSLLLLGWLLWVIYRQSPHRWLHPVALITALVAVVVAMYPTLDLSVLPFALLGLMVFLCLPLFSVEQAVLIWLAVPFLGYNFVVALGLTHIYTIVPAWSLIAAMSLYRLYLISPPRPYAFGLIAYVGLSLVFLGNAFLRTDVAYWQDYPAGNLALFWTPYDEPPAAGFFGFVHRAGWKGVGQQLETAHFVGDYNSNEEPDVTTWYTRGAPRSCDARPEFYFIATDLVDVMETPTEIIAQQYTNIGELVTPNGKVMALHQLSPSTIPFGSWSEAPLAEAFDRTAYPSAFTRSATDVIPMDYNFAQQIQLQGYQVDTRRLAPAGRIPVTLYWQALTELTNSYHVFVQLIQEGGGVVAQADGVPVCWRYPTEAWRPGQLIADQYALDLPAELSPGHYRLEVGLYLPETNTRLDWLDVAGNPGGVSVVLTSVVY